MKALAAGIMVLIANISFILAKPYIVFTYQEFMIGTILYVASLCLGYLSEIIDKLENG